MKFESSFPLSRITMREFESKEIKGERVDDSVLISKFQSTKGFEDISNQESLTYKMLTYRSESPRQDMSSEVTLSLLFVIYSKCSPRAKANKLFQLLNNASGDSVSRTDPALLSHYK